MSLFKNNSQQTQNQVYYKSYAKNGSRFPIIHCISLNSKSINFFSLLFASLLPFPFLSFLCFLEYSKSRYIFKAQDFFTEFCQLLPMTC